MLASAIAFRGLAALVPGLLFVVGLLGFFDLEEVWRQDVVPDLKKNVSPAAFEFLNQTVIKVLERNEVFWVTIGAALAVFQAGSVARAVTRGIHRLYDYEERRGFWRRIGGSLVVGGIAGLLFAGALAVTQIGELAIERQLGDSLWVDVAGFAIRWGLGVVLLFGALAVVLRGAPDAELPKERITAGALLTIGGWVVGTILFGLYLEYLASYGSVFGNLATVFILVEYLFGLSMVLLAGLAVDSILQRERTGSARSA